MHYADNKTLVSIYQLNFKTLAHELNIHNIADAKKDHEDFKTKNKSQKDLSVYDDNNINYDELEEIMRDKM